MTDTPPQPPRRQHIRIKTKFLIRLAIVVVALFAIALPLGDRTHGLGRHSRAVADFGQVVFTIFEVGVVVLVLLAITAFVQHALLRRTTRQTQ